MPQKGERSLKLARGIILPTINELFVCEGCPPTLVSDFQ